VGVDPALADDSRHERDRGLAVRAAVERQDLDARSRTDNNRYDSVLVVDKPDWPARVAGEPVLEG
jgi:hypothetical protein